VTASPFIVSVDPGLDATALVRFDLRRWTPSSSFGVAARAFNQDSHVIPTSPDMLLTDRLVHLASEIARVCGPGGDLEAGLVYVEMPAKAGGAYRAMRTNRGTVRNAADVGKLHMAIGALIVGLRAAPVMVVPFPAPAFSKDRKHEAVREVLQQLGIPDFARGPRGGENADVLDAVFNGLWVLTTPGLQPPLPLDGVGKPSRFTSRPG
jgi:hypothetical protein